VQAYLEKIRQARVYDVAIESPLELAPRLSKRLGQQVWFKREDLQPVFSFKLRGAFNKISSLPQSVAAKGVVCASAGNHAQGVALAARHLGISAYVVMPLTTPEIKVRAVQELGATIELVGEDFDSAYAYACQLAVSKGMTFIHPFDDAEVIAGQGTIAMEICRQYDPAQIAAVFVPIGGGGLIAGIGAYIKALFPQIKIIGVEPFDAASMAAALKAKQPITLDRVGIFADGVAVKRVGDETFRVAREVVDEIVCVDTDEICAAIQDIFEDTRGIVEPAGALAVAGVKRYCQTHQPLSGALITINCGANMNFDRLRHVSERAEFGQRREALFAVQLQEKTGSFLNFAERLGPRPITEFNYRYQGGRQAHVFVGLALSRGDAERHEIAQQWQAEGQTFVDMTDSEMAKLHIRYLIGGKADTLTDERLFRFEFPERPGALLKFLRAVGSQWNVSLFHYRNHGSDYGRVLVGIQVPPATAAEFQSHLDQLNFAYWEETDNPAYRIFLRMSP